MNTQEFNEQRHIEHAERMWNALGHTEAKCGPKDSWIARAVAADRIEWEYRAKARQARWAV